MKPDIRNFGRHSFVRTTGLVERVRKAEKMTEHLFKLKKDGKTVGYLKIADGRVLLNPIGRPGYWFPHDGHLCVNWFDIAHPFVTKDKNGKDVFTGDKVNWRPEDIDELCGEESEEILEAEVAGGFLVYDVEGTDFVEASKFKDIELIEDKEND